MKTTLIKATYNKRLQSDRPLLAPLSAFKKYKEHMFAEHGGFSEYDSEVGQRLGQLHWILDQTTKLHKKVLDSCEDRLENLDNWAMEGLEIMTESFYFYTGRLAEIFKMNPNFATLPKTCAELVRHRLLQHPEKEKSKAKPHPAFYAGSLENGPEIKSYIGPDGSQNDGGLFINAKELDNVVANVINRATENIPNKSSNLTVMCPSYPQLVDI